MAAHEAVPEPLCRATFYDSSWDNRGVCRQHPATAKASAQHQQQTNLKQAKVAK